MNSKSWRKAGMPVSMPSSNGIVAGPWSSVPLWRGLDSSFLCEPEIPKPPLTPRFKVDDVIAIPKLPHNPFFDSAKPTRAASPAEPKPLLSTDGNSQKWSKPPAKLLLLSAALGFIGGMIMAWCSGLLG
jgi:hypothetical protein